MGNQATGDDDSVSSSTVTNSDNNAISNVVDEATENLESAEINNGADETTKNVEISNAEDEAKKDVETTEISNGDAAEATENGESVDCVESEKSSLSSASYSNSSDANEANFRSFCASKPHRGNDIRWDAIQCVKAKDGDMGLCHFRLLKKLGCGDIGSVYLAELRGMSCLFAMKVMDKGMLEERKKLMRAQTEREILGLLDHPFLPTLYSHFETEKFSCLLMEFCSGGDLHTLRQRQPGKHFSEQAARFVPNFLD